MIRWRFVITRLIIVIAVVAVLRWGLGPVARYLTIAGFESATGAKVEIATARVGLFPPRIQYTDFRIADPRAGKSMRNAFRADTIDLVIDGDALLHRRWIASDARITGLQLGSRRELSGHINSQESQEPISASDAPSMMSRLFGAAADDLGAQAGSIVNDLETVRCGRQIKNRWDAQYRSLGERARNLEERIRTVRDEVRKIDNPLRDLPELERTLARARDVRAELMAVRESIDALPETLQADLAELDQAKQIDLARIDQYVPGNLAKPGEFGMDMITEGVRQQIQQIRGYIDGGRTLVQYTVVEPETVRNRGVTYNFDGMSQPQWMIRRCELDGVMRAGGNTYAMTGIAENLTATPELLAEPTRVRLRLEGPETVRAEYTSDRRGGSDIHSVTLHWPQLNPRPFRLGNEHDAGITVQGGQCERWVQVTSEGDRLQGRFVSKQTGLIVSLSVAPEYADSVAAKSLGKSLAAVDQIEIDATFDGTWTDLGVQLSCNLTPIFDSAVRDAFDRQIRDSRERLADKVEKAHSEQTLGLSRWLVSQQREAQSLLAGADKSLEEMSKKVLDEVGDADAYLGRLRSAIRGQLR